MSIQTEIKDWLLAHSEAKYADFIYKINPILERETILGVRTPLLRAYAKEVSKDPRLDQFLLDLPHQTFEENQLHAMIISGGKDIDLFLGQITSFLPYINNWATTDIFTLRQFKKNRPQLLEASKKWIQSDHTYTVRLAIIILMSHFLAEDFQPDTLQAVLSLEREEYYINMARAWYMAEGLAKNWDKFLPVIQNRQLDSWTHNKAIQKAIESRKIYEADKELLKSYRLKKK